MKRIPLTLVALLAAGFAVVGCSQTGEGLAEDAAKNTNAVANVADNAGQAVANGVSTTVNAAANAGDVVANAGTATVVTGAVKLAITANPELNADGNTINVDTKDGKIVLRGKVKSEALKQKAEQIAMKVKKDKGFSETVVNQLTVGM